MADDELGERQTAAPETMSPEELARRWFTASGELTPRRAHLRRLADAGRLVIERMANTDVADDVIERAAELLEEAAAQLDGPGRVRRYEGFAESANAGGDPNPHFDHSPIFGMASPLAPPTRIEIGDDGRSVVLHVRYGTAYEGPPGIAHGGFLALLFDCVLQHLSCDMGVAGKTARLAVRYRRPTPLATRLRIEASRELVDDRIRSQAQLYLDGELLCDAEMTAVAGSRDALPSVSPRRSS